MKDKLLKKFLGFSIGNVATMLLGVISTPIVTRVISTSDYGYFSMFTLITSMATVLLIFGLDHSYARFFYNEDEKNIGVFLFKCLRVPIYVSIVFTVVFLSFGKFITTAAFARQSVLLIVLIVVHSIVGLINRFALLNVRMQQNAKKYSFLQIANKVLYIGSVLVIFFFDTSFYSVIYATVIANILVTLIAVFTERDVWNVKNIVNSFKDIGNTKIHKIVTYGSPMILTFMSDWIFQYSDRFFVKYYKGYSELGVYAAAFSIVSLITVVQSSFTTFWSPVSFERYKNDSEDYGFFRNINDLVSFGMFGFCILVLLFKDVIVLFLGSDYRSATYIMPFLVFMPVMYTISETTVIGINFKMKPKFHIMISILSLLLNLIGNVILIPTMGANGAAISTGISYVFLFYMRTLISKSLYPVKYSMGKMSIMIAILVALSTYCTLKPFNIYTVLFGGVSLAILLIVYKNTVKEVYTKARMALR